MTQVSSSSTSPAKMSKTTRTYIKRAIASIASLAVASSFVTPAHAFIEELLNQAFQGGDGGGNTFHFQMGGGGGFQQIGGRGRGQPKRTEFPEGIEERIDKEFNWLRGTEWYWNRWANVKFNKDGTFEARTQSCVGGCKWAAYEHQGEKKVMIMWGTDGLHVMRVRGQFPTDQSQEQLEAVELSGYRSLDNQEPTRQKEPCNAYFEKVFDHDAFKDSRDLYDALGLGEKNAQGEVTEADIKKAYRKLSLKYHPDKNDDPASIAKYQDITAAYEVLGDPTKRARYNCCGMEGVKGEMPQGRDMSMQIPVTLEELYSGARRKDQIRRRTICRVCRSDPGNPQCEMCGRCPNEMKMVQRQIGPGMVIQQQEEVPSKDKCKQEVVPLVSDIERGMADGDQIKFQHMAEQTPGVLPGDVVLDIKQKPHRIFTRKGNDLHMQIKISLKEALLGFRRDIPHLDGHKVVVKTDKVTSPFQVFRVSEEGMPHKGDPTSFGHLFVKVEVVMPKKLTAQQAGLVEQLFPDGGQSGGHKEQAEL